MNVDTYGLWHRQVDWLMWQLINLVATHYMYLEEWKFNKSVVKIVVETIVQVSILRACTTVVTNIMPSWSLKRLW
jgi:hypothetical protein